MDGDNEMKDEDNEIKDEGVEGRSDVENPVQTAQPFKNIFTTLNTEAINMITLETTTRKQVRMIGWLTFFSIIWGFILLPIGVTKANLQWIPGGCTDSSCSVASFERIVWTDFIVQCIISLFIAIFFVFYAWTLSFKSVKVRPESWWALILIPVLTIPFNPLLSLDRVPGLVSFSAEATSVLAILRYLATATATVGFTLYMVAKFGSLTREEDVDVPYPWRFYLVRGGLGLLLFAMMVSLCITYRVEMSVQPLVALVTLGRPDFDGDGGVYIAAITVGVTQTLVFVFFIVACYDAGRRISKKSYLESRLKHLNLQFFWQHTFLPLGTTILITTFSSLCFPDSLARYMSPSASGSFTERYVLDLPYYLRSGVAFAYSMYAALEAYAALPAVYKPTWIETQLREKVGQTTAKITGLDVNVQTDRTQEEKIFPLNWEYEKKEPNGQYFKDPTKLVFEELVYCFNLSWLVYCTDDIIEACTLHQNDLGSKYVLRNIWRESMRDLVLLVLESDYDVVVAFRGTVSPRNWKINFMMGQTKHPPLQDPEWLRGKWKKPAVGGGPQVHSGFWQAYESIRDELLIDLKDCFREVPTRKRLLCTGHSLGGALATLIAFDSRVELGLGEEQVSLITFGSPMVGNLSFARRFNATILDNFRIVNHSDAITNVPKTYVTHFEHVPRGVLIDPSGNMIIDPMYVDTKFFHGNQLTPHMMASYRDNLLSVIEKAGVETFKPDFWDFSLFEELLDDELMDHESIDDARAVSGTLRSRRDLASELGYSGSIMQASGPVDLRENGPPEYRGKVHGMLRNGSVQSGRQSARQSQRNSAHISGRQSPRGNHADMLGVPDDGPPTNNLEKGRTRKLLGVPSIRGPVALSKLNLDQNPMNSAASLRVYGDGGGGSSAAPSMSGSRVPSVLDEEALKMNSVNSLLPSENGSTHPRRGSSQQRVAQPPSVRGFGKVASGLNMTDPGDRRFMKGPSKQGSHFKFNTSFNDIDKNNLSGQQITLGEADRSASLNASEVRRFSSMKNQDATVRQSGYLRKYTPQREPSSGFSKSVQGRLDSELSDTTLQRKVDMAKNRAKDLG